MPVKCMRKRALSLKELLDIAIEMTDLQHGKRCGIKWYDVIDSTILCSCTEEPRAYYMAAFLVPSWSCLMDFLMPC